MDAANKTVRAPRLPRALGRRSRVLLERIRTTPRPLALLLAVAALLGTAWSLVEPPFQGPDESDHFAFVQHLAETGSPPSSTEYSGAGSYSTEQLRALTLLGLVATINNPAARPMWSAVDQQRWQQFEDQLPAGARSDGDGLDPAAKNPPLYYLYESAAYRLSLDTSLLGRSLATRLGSVLLFVLTVGLVWVAASELTRRAWARVLATGVVALQPQLAFMGGIVNPDILLVAIWTAFVTLSIRTLSRGPTTARVLGLFALAAASALTHGRGIAILPALAIVLVLSWWHDRPPWRVAGRWIAGGALMLGAALIAFRLYSASNGGGSLYGGQATGFTQQRGFNLPQFASHIWQFYFAPLPTMQPRLGPAYGFRQMFVETFYGTFGSLDVRFSPRVFSLLQLASVAGLVALYTALVARWGTLRGRRHIAIALIGIAASTILFLHLVSFLALLGSADPIIVGRYALPLISLFALAITFVATSLPRRLGPLFAAVVLATGVLLQLAGLGLTLTRFYG